MKLRCRYNTNRHAYEVCDGLTVVASFSRMSEAEAFQVRESYRREYGFSSTPEIEPYECAFHGRHMTLDMTVETWGLGRCCLGCGLPVSLRIEHPVPTKAEVTAP